MYTNIVQSIADGTWDPSVILWEQMKATVAPEGIHLPFVGPISDSTGKSRLGTGDELNDEQLNRICWFVDGVVTNDGTGDVPAVVPASCGGDI